MFIQLNLYRRFEEMTLFFLNIVVCSIAGKERKCGISKKK